MGFWKGLRGQSLGGVLLQRPLNKPVNLLLSRYHCAHQKTRGRESSLPTVRSLRAPVSPHTPGPRPTSPAPLLGAWVWPGAVQEAWGRADKCWVKFLIISRALLKFLLFCNLPAFLKASPPPSAPDKLREPLQPEPFPITRSICRSLSEKLLHSLCRSPPLLLLPTA